MNIFEKFIKFLSAFTFYLTMGGLTGITFLTFSDVFMRYVFNRPILGVYDTTRIILIITVACAFGQTQLSRGNMSIDLILTKLKMKPKIIINSIHDFISFLLFLIITWQVFKHGFLLKGTGESTETIFIPFYPFVFIIGFNTSIVCIILLYQFIKSVEEIIRK